MYALTSNSRRRGFTMLELLIALLIIGVATTSLLAWTAQLLEMSYAESLAAAAIQSCQFKMEEIKALRYDQVVIGFSDTGRNFSLPASEQFVLDTRGTPNEPDDDILATRTITISPVTESSVPLKEVFVQVNYSFGGEEYSEELRTWVSEASR